jgi:hypothetical protein
MNVTDMTTIETSLFNNISLRAVQFLLHICTQHDDGGLTQPKHVIDCVF